ncbi:MAG: AAA family ATPase [Pseudomonadota bacterium]
MPHYPYKRHLGHLMHGIGGQIDPALDECVRIHALNFIAHGPFRQLTGKALRQIEDCDIVHAVAEVDIENGLVHDDLTRAELSRALKKVQRRHGKAPVVPPEPAEPFAGCLAALAQVLDLDPLEKQALTFLAAVHSHSQLKELIDHAGDLSLGGCAKVIGICIAASHELVRKALSPAGTLMSSGLVSVEQNNIFLSSKIELKASLLEALSSPGLDRVSLLARFLDRAPDTTLERADFQHQAGSVDSVLALLGGALKLREKGINILLHGPTGTGKTELARLLAKLLGVELYQAGRVDEQGESPLPNERLRSLLLSQSLLAQDRGLILFDEMEDLFSRDGPLGFLGGRASGHMSKQWFNHQLENNPLPTIWISNETDRFDVAYLRRFSLVIEFKPLNAAQRARALRRHLGEGSSISSADVDRLAELHEVSPAQLATAVRCATIMAADRKPSVESIEKVLTPTIKLMTGKDPALVQAFDPGMFDVTALNSSDDLEGLANRLEGWKPEGPRGVTLCLYGAPGTGKSEYARYLAWRMKRKVVCKRGSDILSMWVGESEKNITRAFEEASDTEAMLLFDEVDSMLRDRNLAFRSWEVSQVNEFLQQLEVFRGIAVCTTNLWKDIDQAALRRFVFKAEFHWLRPEQACSLFKKYFVGDRHDADDVEQALTSVRVLHQLAPGDYAAVKRRLDALGETPTCVEIARRLTDECSFKKGPIRSIGFGA